MWSIFSNIRRNREILVGEVFVRWWLQPLVSIRKGRTRAQREFRASGGENFTTPGREHVFSKVAAGGRETAKH